MTTAALVKHLEILFSLYSYPKSLSNLLIILILADKEMKINVNFTDTKQCIKTQ
jgi:hypothetical protein